MIRDVRVETRGTLFSHGRTFCLLLFTWIAFALYIGIPRNSDQEVLDRLTGENNEGLPPAHLHLLVPASKADPNLCKVMVSAAVTGYPAPVIINWNQSFDAAEFVEGGSHLAKIRGVSEYLENLGSSNDMDLVLMVDGYDIWLQLPAEVLIKRYFDINTRADARIAAAIGESAMSGHGIRQEIIFGCQKRCWPWTQDDPPCYAVPQSSLPEDIYGADTDTDTSDELNPYIKFRPRFLNSGVAMGTVRAMRKLFRQALVLLPEESNMGSDQYIFSHIFGDQEVYRETVQRDSTWLPDRFAGLKAKEKTRFNDVHIDEVRAKAGAQDDGTFEFNIGLDYGSELGLNTVFAEDDTAWLYWNDTSSLQAAEAALSIPPGKSNMQLGLAPDILASPPPFWTFNHDLRLSLLRSLPWSAVSLFTNVYTGIVPAVIHHNAHRDGRKALRETWWPNIWFANHTRNLYDAYVLEPTVPVAKDVGYGVKGRDWWPFYRGKAGGKNGPLLDAIDPSFRWVGFEDICRSFHEEVFRDGKGEWVQPETL